MACKRKRCDLVGYITTISPQKSNKSFRLQIQTGDTSSKKAICFDQSKLTKLKQKKVSGEALKFKRVLLDEAPQKNFAEIIINNESILDDPDVVQC